MTFSHFISLTHETSKAKQHQQQLFFQALKTTITSWTTEKFKFRIHAEEKIFSSFLIFLKTKISSFFELVRVTCFTDILFHFIVLLFLHHVVDAMTMMMMMKNFDIHILLASTSFKSFYQFSHMMKMKKITKIFDSLHKWEQLA